MEAKLMLCGQCKHFCHHKKISVVKFLTKHRVVTTTSYQCSNCNAINLENHEEENNQVEVWD